MKRCTECSQTGASTLETCLRVRLGDVLDLRLEAVDLLRQVGVALLQVRDLRQHLCRHGVRLRVLVEGKSRTQGWQGSNAESLAKQ